MLQVMPIHHSSCMLPMHDYEAWLALSNQHCLSSDIGHEYRQVQDQTMILWCMCAGVPEPCSQGTSAPACCICSSRPSSTSCSSGQPNWERLAVSEACNQAEISTACICLSACLQPACCACLRMQMGMLAYRRIHNHISGLMLKASGKSKPDKAAFQPAAVAQGVIG